jgi:hypothetical protein
MNVLVLLVVKGIYQGLALCFVFFLLFSSVESCATNWNMEAGTHIMTGFVEGSLCTLFILFLLGILESTNCGVYGIDGRRFCFLEFILSGFVFLSCVLFESFCQTLVYLCMNRLMARGWDF